MIPRSEAESLSRRAAGVLHQVFATVRADFAYRYLARIAGRDPEFDNDPAVRDEQIARLRAAL